MSFYFQSGSATALAERRPFSWRAFFGSAVERVRVYFAHRKQRRELLDYMASDHRAAADLGITSHEARNLPMKPFRRG